MNWTCDGRKADDNDNLVAVAGAATLDADPIATVAAILLDSQQIIDHRAKNITKGPQTLANCILLKANGAH